jgi:hypothetical protein
LMVWGRGELTIMGSDFLKLKEMKAVKFNWWIHCLIHYDRKNTVKCKHASPIKWWHFSLQNQVTECHMN